MGETMKRKHKVFVEEEVTVAFEVDPAGVPCAYLFSFVVLS